MLAGTLEPSSAGPFLFAEKRCLIFPHQESRKQSERLKTDSRTITEGLLIISAVRLMHFPSFVSAVFVRLPGPPFPRWNLMQFTPCWLRSGEEPSKECLPTGNRECFYMLQVTNALSLLTPDLSLLQSSFPLQLPWVICQLPELYVVNFLLL